MLLCSERHKDRSEEEKKKLMNRLKRIEGQIRGIEGMVEKKMLIVLIFLFRFLQSMQTLNSFNKELLAKHIKTCVVDDIKEGHDETIDELVKVLQKVMK